MSLYLGLTLNESGSINVRKRKLSQTKTKIKLSHAVDNDNVFNDGTSDTQSHFFCLYISAAFINVVRRLGY